MANYQTTFGDLQIDERFKKLQRSLKLAVLKQEHSKSVQGRKVPSMTAWPSISSINVDTLDSSYIVPSLQNSIIRSEVLTSSKNLRSMLLNKNNCNIKQQALTTSSLKHYHVQQDNHVDRLLMPPPEGSIKPHHGFREPLNRRTLSNCEETKSTLLNRSLQSSTENTFSLKSPSSISTNTNAGKECPNTFIAPTTPVNNFQQIDRVFSKWRVMLNDRYELIIKGTLECGTVARSKPVIRRYSATCVESKYRHKYILEGNIIDERNGLPDYIRGKFYNGFPDDWENVYQIWRTYISQGCLVTFRWPTPITDSDDDLKSEMTDLTYKRVRSNKTNKIVPSTESCNLNECTKTKSLLNNTFEKKEEYQNHSTRSLQNYEKNTSFVKPFISNSEKHVIPVVQTKNTKSLCDEDNEQDLNTDINPPSILRKVSKLKDKLNIIINNLTNRNYMCPKYIDKINEMIDCFEYVISYKTDSECNNDSMVSVSRETLDSERVPVQQSFARDDNCANANKLENKLPKFESYRHSTDLGYGSVRNDSNTIQLSNDLANVKPEQRKNSDESESETYAGVPKISNERLLKLREMSRKMYKRKVKKKTDAQKHVSSLPHSEEAKFDSVHMANSATNTKKNSHSDESCISVTEDEVEIMNDMNECRKTVDIQRPQKTMFNHREIQRNNFVYGKDKPVMHVQNEQPFDEERRVNLDVFIKEQNTRRNIQMNAHPQFVADVDHTTNSDVDVATVSTNTQKGGSTIASHTKIDQDIVILSESNSNFPEKPCASSKLRREFIEQTKNEIAVKKSKPTIVSSMPVNFNVREISGVDSKTGHSKIIIKENKQNTNIRPLEKTDKKSKTIIAAKPAISDSKITVDNKKEVHSIPNKRNESNNINFTNLTTNPRNEQSKNSKLGIKKKGIKMLTVWTPKVVHYEKSESKLGLTFQGKLLNEVGHVVHRKFTTDIIARRLSSTLIETINHEMYELLGHLNDNKHSIPKELVRQCRYGCPAEIEQFCWTWKTLQQGNIKEVSQEKLHDATMDSLNALVSSRGRRILPPLNYWIGERISWKDNNPVYSPGNSQESTLSGYLSLTNNSKEMEKNISIEERKKHEVNSKNTSSPKKQSVSKKTLLSESNKTSGTSINEAQASKNSPKIKTANNIKKYDNSRKSRKSINNKRRLAQKLIFSSTDSSEEEKITRKHNSQANENANLEPPRYALRKRQKIESSNKILRSDAKSRHHAEPTKKLEMTYAYYRNIPLSKDFLSEVSEI